MAGDMVRRDTNFTGPPVPTGQDQAMRHLDDEEVGAIYKEGAKDIAVEQMQALKLYTAKKLYAELVKIGARIDADVVDECIRTAERYHGNPVVYDRVMQMIDRKLDQYEDIVSQIDSAGAASIMQPITKPITPPARRKSWWQR